MNIAVKMAMFVLAGFLSAAPAQGANVFPLQTRQWMEMAKQDQQGHTWTVRVDVLEKVTLSNKQYFHVLQQNYDPPEEDTVDDNYVRSTATEVFVYNKATGGEMLVFQLGPVGTNWTYAQPDGTTIWKEIVAIEDITVPYGGPYTSYKFRQHSSSSPDHYEWVVPGLGFIAKEEDYWVSQGRAPVNSALTRMNKVPAVWTGRYSFVDIDYPQTTNTLMDMRGLNDLGQIVGSYTSGGRQYAFIKNGTTYSTLSGITGTNSIAWGINDAGIVAGPHVLNGVTHAFMYNTTDNSLTPIDISGSFSTTAAGINGSGKVSGYYHSDKNYGFMYDINTTSLTSFGKAGATSTLAYGCNNAGITVGNYTLPDGRDYGFTYDGTIHDFNVPGALNTRATGINDHGDIAGRYWTDASAIHGFVYTDGVFNTLDIPGAEIVRVTGINNARQIVGLYTKDGGASYHGFLGTPVSSHGLPFQLLLLLE
jgi:probable HAF family extracellular repeat protein